MTSKIVTEPTTGEIKAYWVHGTRQDKPTISSPQYVISVLITRLGDKINKAEQDSVLWEKRGYKAEQRTIKAKATVEKLRQENATLSAYIDNVNSAVADLMKELAGTTK